MRTTSRADGGRQFVVPCRSEHDLYTKSHTLEDVAQLKGYYLELIKKYFPAEKLVW